MFRALVTSFILIVISFSSFAQLTQNLTIGNAKALALANAVTADPPGTDSFHFNPAGIFSAFEKGACAEFQFVYTPKPKIEFNARWTGEYSDANVNLNDCDAECFTLNEDNGELNSFEVDSPLVYLPWKGSAEAGSLLPRGGYVYRGNRFAFGTSTYATSAGGYDATNTIARYPLEKVATINLVLASPGFAFKVSETLTVGMAFPLNYSGAEGVVKLRTPNLLVGIAADALSTICSGTEDNALCREDGTSIPLYDDALTLEFQLEDQLTPSYNLGFLWQPYEWISFGGVFQSAVKHELKGKYHNTYDESVAVLVNSGLLNVLPGFPQVEASDSRIYEESGDLLSRQSIPKHFALGVSLVVTPRLRINVDYKKTYYSAWNQLALVFDSETVISALGGLFRNDPERTASSPLGYIDNDNFAIGAEYKISDRYSVRLGYEYRPSVIPDHNKAYGGLLTDTQVIGLGGSIRLSKEYTLDISLGNVSSDQSIPNGTSYVNTWDNFELFAQYPGYDLSTEMNSSLLIFGISKTFTR